jgi:hypothetical protein
MCFQKSLFKKKIELLSESTQFTSAFQSTTNNLTMASMIPNSDNSTDNEQVNDKQVNPNPKPKPSEPSICIPRVFKSTSRKDIFGVIEKLDLGAVDRIDLVAKTNERGESYNKVFIHFKIWNRNPQAQATRDKLLQGEEIKIVYSEPWFWKCTASRVEKPAFRDYTAPPPRIDLGGSKSLSKHDATNEDAKQ